MIRDLVLTYRKYYTQVLMHRHSLKENERTLYAQLKNILKDHGKSPLPPKTLDRIELELKALLRLRGYYSLFGTIHPFRSLSIWKTQRAKQQTIKLPETK